MSFHILYHKKKLNKNVFGIKLRRKRIGHAILIDKFAIREFMMKLKILEFVSVANLHK